MILFKLLIFLATKKIVFKIRTFGYYSSINLLRFRNILIQIKFFSAVVLATLWFLLCAWLAQPWLRDLSRDFGFWFALAIITFIGLIPGFINIFMTFSYLMGKYTRTKKTLTSFPAVTILIAAYNEEKTIQNTIQAIVDQHYPGVTEIIVVDDGSIDNTVKYLQAMAIENLIVIQAPHKGKANALNIGLQKATHELLITIDADTLLRPCAITNLITHLEHAAPNVAAIAGSLYVENWSSSFLTKLQHWDYLCAIASIKRVQGLFKGTLVAQGAFSLFRKHCIQEAGGWQNTLGEDIVLSWQLLKRGYEITYADDAIAFTHVPVKYKQFFSQRSRWARGMLEAFRANPEILVKPRLSMLFVYWNLFFPAIDFFYLFVFCPGVIATFFGYYYIAGFMTLLVLPIALFQGLTVALTQNNFLKKHKMHFKMQTFNFLIYMLFYNLFMAPACIHGYISELLSIKKRWGTK